MENLICCLIKSLPLAQRHKDRRPRTTACPACCSIGTRKAKKCKVMKILFYTGLRAANAGQNSIVPTRRAQRTQPGKDPFYMNSRSPHVPQFQQSAGASCNPSLGPSGLPFTFPGTRCKAFHEDD
jgi:hypothetical protein